MTPSRRSFLTGAAALAAAVVTPETVKRARSQLAGPMWPTALFEKA